MRWIRMTTASTAKKGQDGTPASPISSPDGAGSRPGRPGWPPWRCIEFQSILRSIKTQKSEFNCSQGRFLHRRAHPILSQLEAKMSGQKTHFGQNQLGIYMIFGNQHASKMRGQDRGRQEAQKAPNGRFWPET